MSETEGTESVALDKETADILRRMATRSGRTLSKLTQDLCELYAEQNGWSLTWNPGEPKESEREELWTKWSSMPDDERRKAWQLMTLGRSGLNSLHRLWNAWQRQTSQGEKALLALMDSPDDELFAVAIRLLSLDDSQLNAVYNLLETPETIHDIVTPTDDTPSEAKEPADNSNTCGSCVHVFVGKKGTFCRRFPPMLSGGSVPLHPRVDRDTQKCGEYREDSS